MDLYLENMQDERLERAGTIPTDCPILISLNLKVLAIRISDNQLFVTTDRPAVRHGDILNIL